MFGRIVGVRASSPERYKQTISRRLGVWLQRCFLVTTCCVVAGPAFARTAYDGSWSVVVITRGGACDPTFRYGVEIINGQIVAAGGSGAEVHGRVNPGGAVGVSVRAGGQWASGSGRLTRNRGGGAWRGQGNRGFCQGTWVAERTGFGGRAESGGPAYGGYGYAPPRARGF